ncbi:uncharacterized protein BJ171DRAFT_477077 [Polychytrium aggregatum]|uniref:uncharacterized protein n=1 Tax=Polychytrium aggregatum TaxID=110093 RepID=UPI0022FF3D40|nr:uncharacterized protein BJ171DRAFT_477077 [Polychytrium aggregatum]KAI9201984.1 hypothetical protein BJ171DRAFT_477077 [Polychytrium aggregatum]
MLPKALLLAALASLAAAQSDSDYTFFAGVRYDNSTGCRAAVAQAEVDYPVLKSMHALFFSTPKSICDNLDAVVSASDSVAHNCVQTWSDNQGRGAWQQSAIYSIWSNRNAAQASCAIDQNDTSKFCIESVWIAQIDSPRNDVPERLCSACQKSWWTSFNLNATIYPHTYYWSLNDIPHYLDRIKSVCGANFFDN